MLSLKCVCACLGVDNNKSSNKQPEPAFVPRLLSRCLRQRSLPPLLCPSGRRPYFSFLRELGRGEGRGERKGLGRDIEGNVQKGKGE